MNLDTLLHRQIHSVWVQQQRITSQAFKPTPKDNRLLSVYDGGQTTAEQAWLHYTGKLGHTSIGVQSVSVAECSQLDLPAEADPKPFPAHAIIRFDNCTSNSQIEKKAKKLTTFAAIRGWQYRKELDV